MYSAPLSQHIAKVYTWLGIKTTRWLDLTHALCMQVLKCHMGNPINMYTYYTYILSKITIKYVRSADMQASPTLYFPLAVLSHSVLLFSLPCSHLSLLTLNSLYKISLPYLLWSLSFLLFPTFWLIISRTCLSIFFHFFLHFYFICEPT
jgi:hypothetical protein